MFGSGCARVLPDEVRDELRLLLVREMAEAGQPLDHGVGQDLANLLRDLGQYRSIIGGGHQHQRQVAIMRRAAATWAGLRTSLRYSAIPS